ncbi:ribosomal large subunit pseudouridine synthase B [Gottschalkia acidurici 9a]|uniref:Pseudouridine synthase n=1 Tax=Gottschalkia acidurici (strain ATCC 7906 / DSM 604 / BCRC 14475 / CIP 104303 / KCTC 5404 / NCIMB 10678 / 9a) TaxID=1128398 RepID=K0AZE9_GOTA9|nr:pseudouridine synthase [Gottschalkia acidurici]AFS78080.1 ribosomal large subunit pseudouridine synthase B [Gottschalkia acidurici 9a]
MEKKERLDKVLSNMGYGSRKDVKELCRKGLVKIDGEVIKDRSYKFNPFKSKIELEDEEVIYREYIYLMMNKPQDVISATYDNRSETVIDIIDDEYKIFDPFPVGRLDKDTEGLLLISNDGKLAHQLLSPKKHVEKTYYAEIQGVVTEEDGRKFSEGVYIEDDYKTLPAKLEIIESDQISKINLTIVEGKFHQVKRMFEAVEKKVIYLQRISMGTLKLDEDLELGEYRELTESELNELKESVK